MKWLLCFVVSAFCQSVFCQVPGELTHADSVKRDRELRLFLQELHRVATSRDTAKLFPLIDEQAEVQPLWMDGVYASGKNQFIRFWNLGSTKDTSVFWRLLSEASQMEGMYATPGRMEYYIFPRYNPEFRQDAWLVMADSIGVYSEPDTASKIVRWLPKGTEIAPWNTYRYNLPLWIKCPVSYPDTERVNEWIRTNGIYIYGWQMSVRYKKGKWFLYGISGFEYLYPKSH